MGVVVLLFVGVVTARLYHQPINRMGSLMLACISIPVSKSCLLYFCRLFEWLMIPANLSGLTFDANLTKIFVLKISTAEDKQ